MTNTILVSIGILLASSAAMMVTFYGGSVFADSQKTGEASRIVVESAQIASAFDAFVQRERRLPGAGGSSQDALNDLLNGKYLSEIPRGAQNSGWSVDYSEGMIYSVLGAAADDDNLDICRAARAQLELPEPENVYKCDGSDHPSGALPQREPCCIK